MKDNKKAYRIHTSLCECYEVPESSIEKSYCDVPESIVLMLNTKSYAVMVEDGVSSVLRVKEITKKRPIWFSRMKNILEDKKNLGYIDDDNFVHVSVKDIGNDNISVCCIVGNNVYEYSWEGTSEKFYNGEGLSSDWDWLPPYIHGKLRFYDWLPLACVELYLLKNSDNDGARFFKGISTEKGIYGACAYGKDGYCPDGEYTFVEIVCC